MQEQRDSMTYLVNDHMARRRGEAERRRQARAGVGGTRRRARRRMAHLLSMGARG